MVRVKSNDKIIYEGTVDTLPFIIELDATFEDGKPRPRRFTLSPTYWAKPNTYERDVERPKGMKLT